MKEFLQDCDTVITMLPNGTELLSLIEKLYPILNKGTLHIDSSTTSIEDAKEMHTLAGEHVYCLDTPVSGGVIGAVNSSLTFMVGGNGEAYDSAMPIFEVLGQKCVLCGGL